MLIASGCGASLNAPEALATAFRRLLAWLGFVLTQLNRPAAPERRAFMADSADFRVQSKLSVELALK